MRCSDDCGHGAVFPEQDALASQMAAAKFLDTISKFPGLTGEASGAVSAFTQVKMGDAPKLSKLPESECPHI